MARRSIRDNEGPSPARLVIESLLVIALSFAFSFVKLWRMPQGGEVSLVMLPLIMFALLRGFLAGFLAGMSFGFIHFAQNPVMTHPLQFLLDYPLAYGSAGLAGFFARPAGSSLLSLVGVIVAMAGRFACHTLSGFLFVGLFLSSVPANPLLYVVLYNAAYMIPDTVITCAVVEFLLPRLKRFMEYSSQIRG
jgi:thiamine transporter